MNNLANSNHRNGDSEPDSVALELKKESDRLRHLAERLESEQKRIADLESECSTYRRLVYANAAEQFRQQPPIPDKDLQTLVNELDGRPLADFIADLERIANEPA